MSRSATTSLVDLELRLKAIASERRLQILDWLKEPAAHFPPQVHGDMREHGACNQYIVEKLGVSQPAGSRHLRILVDAGLIIPTRRENWVYYRRDEAAIARLANELNHI